jgi:hypothetical protein
MMVPATQLFKTTFKYTLSHNFQKKGSFLEEVTQTLTSSSIKSMFSNQVHLRMHPLSMHILAIEFLKTLQVTCEPDFKSFCDFILSKHSLEAIQDIEKTTRGQSSEAIWFEMRYCRVTASMFNACACAGYALCDSPENFDLTEEDNIEECEHYAVAKLFGAKKFKQTKAMKHGLEMEAPALKCFSKEKKMKVETCGSFLAESHPFISASPDGIGKDFIVEIKSPSEEKNIATYIHQDMLTPAKKVLAQMLLQMWTTGKQKGYLLVVKPEFKKKKVFANLIVTEVNFEDHSRTFHSLLRCACAFYEQKIFPRLLKTAKSYKKFDE